jgi:hypothetical protein
MYTIREFCAFAKISTRHFHTMKAQALGPDVTRFGHSVRITKEAAKEWIDKHTERTT